MQWIPYDYVVFAYFEALQEKKSNDGNFNWFALKYLFWLSISSVVLFTPLNCERLFFISI